MFVPVQISWAYTIICTLGPDEINHDGEITYISRHEAMQEAMKEANILERNCYNILEIQVYIGG